MIGGYFINVIFLPAFKSDASRSVRLDLLHAE